ncbi:MAG: hypothetical protein OXC00_07710 [Acidimicrobiaceae bacterium]|nr:hypothetical protein [Acidimicrobiaceae bacterium]
MAAVTVSRSEGRLVAVKQVPAERADEIEREADLLQRLNHPGLVRFVDIVETANGGRALHTEFVNSDTWASRSLTDPAERAAGMAALAAVVADLHQMGVAHLQITAPHVLHGENDRPVLCGLTSAAEATPENRQTDLAALADLCHDPALGRGALAGKLSSLADAAMAGRLNARELARRLDLLATKRPTGTAPVRAVGGGVLASIRRRCRPKPLIAVGSVVAAVVAAFGLGARSRGPEPAPPVSVLASAEAPSSLAEAGPGYLDESISIETPAPASGPNRPDAAEGGIDPGQIDAAEPAGGPSQIDATELLDDANQIDAASDAAVSVSEAAAVLEHGGRRYAVGATGDFVETGDWDCDGQATAAIVRPSTGGIVLFDAWPGPGETIGLPVRWSVDSPTGAEAVAHGECDLLRVYTTAGSRLFNPGDAS